MSYSSEVKKAIRETNMKKKCCRRCFFYGEQLFLPKEKREKNIDWQKYGYKEGEEPASIIADNFRCASCKNAFLGGVFYSCGTVSDPLKSFHLEIKIKDEKQCGELFEFIKNNCIEMRRTKRNDKYSLYLKRSDDIQDIMYYMGAAKEAFEVANEKIKRDYLGLANRRNNFEVVNIAKTVESAGETIDAINKLTKKGKMKNLPKGLQETARLRVDNPYANLEELAKLHSDRISKSGVNHRLKKLLELANDD